MKDLLTENEWDKFISILVDCKDKDALNILLTFLLTHDERAMIATRLALTDALLQKKKSQRAIASEFEMSIALITRGSNELKRLTAKQKDAIKKLLSA